MIINGSRFIRRTARPTSCLLEYIISGNMEQMTRRRTEEDTLNTVGSDVRRRNDLKHDRPLKDDLLQTPISKALESEWAMASHDRGIVVPLGWLNRGMSRAVDGYCGNFFIPRRLQSHLGQCTQNVSVSLLGSVKPALSCLVRGVSLSEVTRPLLYT